MLLQMCRIIRGIQQRAGYIGIHRQCGRAEGQRLRKLTQFCSRWSHQTGVETAGYCERNGAARTCFLAGCRSCFYGGAFTGND